MSQIHPAMQRVKPKAEPAARSNVLFVGWGGAEGVSHYRTILPAKTMGAEWVIFDVNTGRPVFSEGSATHHDVIIVQNCWYDWQFKIIQAMKAKGSTVLMNVDDWIKSIGKLTTSHGNHELFGKKRTVTIHEQILRYCDGVITSTDWLADKIYNSGLNNNVAVARNGIDAERYRPWMDVERDMGIIIGWAGGTGHTDALRSVSEAVSRVVERHDDVSLWIVGQNETGAFRCKANHAEWSDMHLYPKDLACFDINIAPAMDNDFYRSKSQLRLYEAMTMGTPSVVHPMYDEVGQAGVIARTPAEWERCLEALVSDERLRDRMRHYALKQAQGVTIQARINEWTQAIEALAPAASSQPASVHTVRNS